MPRLECTRSRPEVQRAARPAQPDRRFGGPAAGIITHRAPSPPPHSACRVFDLGPHVGAAREPPYFSAAAAPTPPRAASRTPGRAWEPDLLLLSYSSSDHGIERTWLFASSTIPARGNCATI